MYLTKNGQEISYEQIKEAYDAGKATIIHGYGLNHTTSELVLEDTNIDTRNNSYQMSEAVWSRKPENLKECLNAAYSSI